MVTAKQIRLWGHLQPILHTKRKSSDGTEAIANLPLPGSYGRESLVRPYLDTCHCRQRPTDEKVSPKRSRCADCDSVRSLATFIPRKNLLQFSNTDEGNVLTLEISGNNSIQIVHLHHKNSTCKNNEGGSMNNLLTVQHEDEISLHWQGLGIAAGSDDGTAPSLVRFRVVRAAAVNNLNETGGQKSQDLGCSEEIISVKNDQDQSVRVCRITLDDNHNDNAPDAKKHHEYPFVDESDTHDNINSTRENVDRNKECISDTNDNNLKMDQANGNKPTLTNDQKCDSEEESPEEESAPLTLPMNFAEPSRSLTCELTQNSNPLHKSQSQTETGLTSSQTTPQKSNITSKRKFDVENLYSLHGNPGVNITSEFEKESTNKCTKTSVPISSLTYNQVGQLHQDSNNLNNIQQSSVRHAVLSLTLALTSNASSFDSSLVNAYIDKGNTNTKETSAQTPGKWMPRLLQGTNIVMHEQNRK